MTQQRVRSFAEVTFAEAAARRARVDLVLKPVVAGGDQRLISRFLGTQGPDRLVLAVPRTPKDEKVFVPIGWELGMAFDLAGLWLQARTTVCEHCMFPTFSTKREDGVVVEQPAKILSANRRIQTRHKVDASKPFTATVWSAARIDTGDFTPIQIGYLVDWSDQGLGVRFPHPLAIEAGTRAVIRLERAKTNECLILWAVLRHCTADTNGFYTAGFGEVVNMGPGEAVGLIRFLATGR